MLEKGKISAFQLGIMMYPTVLATSLLALPTITAQYANNDIWLTPIIAALIGIISIYVAIQLHKLYPKMTIIQYSEHIIGKIPGKILGFIFAIYMAQSAGIIVRQYADFVKACFLFKTPLLMIISSIILLAAFASRGGAEVIARSAVILNPIFMLPIFILLLLIRDLDVKNIFPILEHGIIPLIKGSLSPMAWFSEFFLISYFLPYLTDPKKSRKWSMISLCVVFFTMIYVDLISLFLLGTDTGNKIYPILVAFRYISVANFFENLESLLLAMWVVGNFVKISVFYYIAVLSLAQSLKLSEYRPVVFPIGLLIVVFSFWDIASYSQLGLYLKSVSPFQLSIFNLIIPLFLLAIASLRKRKTTDNGKMTS